MPIVHVKVPEGVFDADAKQRLGEGVTKAAADAERVPDDENHRMSTWVLIDEVRSGSWFAAGSAEAASRFIPAVATMHPPHGVLDPAKRQEFAAAFDKAVKQAVPTGDERPVLTSCVISDVPEGHYGVMGRIFALSDFIAMGGYEHLQGDSQSR